MSGRATVAEPAPDGTEVWLIRHGQTNWSASGRHTGRTEIPLTEHGRAQAQALREPFAGMRPALVLCSPRERARETARLAGVRVDEIDDDLAEWDYGDYEGLTTAQIHEAVPGWSLWRHGAPGGESVDAVGARADRVLGRARVAAAEGPVVLIGHGHFSRALGARWINHDVGDGQHLMLDAAARCMLGMEHGVPALAHWNLLTPFARTGGRE